MNWVVVLLFIVAVCAILVAWYGIAQRIIKVRTRENLARLGPAPTDEQLKGLILHNATDDRVRQATGELDAAELHDSIEEIRDVQGRDEAAS